MIDEEAIQRDMSNDVDALNAMYVNHVEAMVNGDTASATYISATIFATIITAWLRGYLVARYGFVDLAKTEPNSVDSPIFGGADDDWLNKVLENWINPNTDIGKIN